MSAPHPKRKLIWATRPQASADKEVRFGACREARRGKVFASWTSCPTLRIFSSNGSRASFCRISGFIEQEMKRVLRRELPPSLRLSVERLNRQNARSPQIFSNRHCEIATSSSRFSLAMPDSHRFCRVNRFIGNRIPQPAGFCQAANLVALDEWQHHQGRHHRRPRSDEANRPRRVE